MEFLIYELAEIALRLVIHPQTFSGAVDAAFDQIRQNSRDKASVSIRLLEVIVSLIPHTQEENQRQALLHQAAMVDHGCREALPEQRDRDDVHARYQEFQPAAKEFRADRRNARLNSIRLPPKTYGSYCAIAARCYTSNECNNCRQPGEGRIMQKNIFTLLMFFLLCATGFAQETEDLTIASTHPESTVSLERFLEEGKILVRVADAEEEPVLGLGAEDFTITQFGKQARIVAVESFKENIDVPRHIVLVLDNSGSMQQRKAVKPLLAAMDELLKIVRPIDQIHLVVFDDHGTQRMGGRDLHVQTFTSSSTVDLKNYVDQVYRQSLTANTFLYEGMLGGLDIVSRMPADAPKFMVVFSDGEDLNSNFTRNDVTQAIQKLDQFEAHAVDFMPGPDLDPFLKSFADRSGGQAWKAREATTLVPVFQAVASKLQSNYIISYLFPLEGGLSVSPTNLTIEEVKTIDASPLLGYLYFETGSSEIPQRYHRFDQQAATQMFDEQDLRGTLEKYAHVMDIIGKRLRENPDATITLVGCNSNYGEEKGRQDLSRLRAVAVRTYLQYIWNIDPARIQIEARNLPEKPSTSRLAEGRSENQRVEIHSEHPALLDLVRSTYTSYRLDSTDLIVRPSIDNVYDITAWQIRALSGGEELAVLAGEGAPADEYRIPLQLADPYEVGTAGRIEVDMTVKDRRNQEVSVETEPIEVQFIQTSQRLAQKLDFRVQEKYALILFDFDRHSIDARNEQIVNQIAERIRDLPQGRAEIVGHTDNIGSDEYNLELSKRRAEAVYNLLQQADSNADGRIQYRGVGAADPPYDNSLPETRAFNRTVIITLEYLTRE
ncbi:OmpA family protein [Geoalkalibacter subterraneus]|uniref:VWA domain-containing protein n=1 Tax=Geoalkalibacter subterraneus TaxID=483547 RepID=A0A0B5FGY4_9BACT|nr:OmpA family protein [Geoalkalibacter subterraneus]AJF06613.1 hypothetical protein GSUB_08720 [Geoalkalibacter subterraneus]